MQRSPALHPLLETLSKSYNRNVKGRQRFLLNLCNVSIFTKNKFVFVPPPPLARLRSLRLFYAPRNESVFDRAGVLSTLQKFNENRCRPLTAFLLKILDNVSSSGSSAGIAAPSHRGSVFKGNKISNLYEYFK